MNFKINEYAEIIRDDELDKILMNVIRVGANKYTILAAYKARKRCYKICKRKTHRLDYREYVEGLQLDKFPVEFKKAEFGKSYLNIWYLIIFSFGFALFIPNIWRELKRYKNSIIELRK